MVNYTKNRWNNYDESKTFAENLENDAILTLEKALHIEQGIYNANRAIEVGDLRIAGDTETPSVKVKYNEDAILMDFVLPRTTLSNTEVNNIINKSKEEFLKLFSRVYVGDDPGIEPNANDVVFVLSQDGRSITSIKTFTKNVDGSMTENELSIKIGIGDILTDPNHQFISQEQLDKLNDIEAGANRYTHPSGDGNLHVPANGSTNNAKFLKSGSNPGEVSWEYLQKEDIQKALGYVPPKPSDITSSLADSQNDGLMSKENFIKLQGIEENANNYTHPNSHSADMILETNDKKFISQQEKEMLKYTSNDPTLSSLGGIGVGETFDNIPVNEMIDKLLHPYVPPVVSCTVTAPGNGGVYEYGVTTDITSVRVGVTRKSKDISKIEVFTTDDLSAPIGTQSEGIAKGGVFNFNINKRLSEINTGLKIRAKVTDVSGKSVTADSGAFYVVYPMFYGAMDDGTVLDDTSIRRLTKLVQTKQNRTLQFNSNNQKLVIAYPAIYGNITQIIDPNGFNITDTFTKYSVPLRFGEGSVDYFVYINDPSTVSDFNISIKY